ncbi:allantoate amidohydrolase [Mycobacterium sp. 852013-50091_SCH5140682]|uniref:allantoate amidohydrolase n=1 Tax=Mycobacterium sp. 852013-50091_SCH5140682 TaxID=1834109 RepID=UPI0007EA423D|nr:allantoate amidohydrolase [Mycobacterium sp. 852013-50091_SCH5140682]OBC16889.1 allantoate amidohydrolase [Mycobacterium sp. 852013-50091_SCH5140682]
MTSLVDRFVSLWASLAPIGRDPGSGGYRRFAWNAADGELRAWFIDQAKQRGLTYEEDRNGNQWAWWGEPRAGSVVTGSHLDSVPDGGAYDGPLGVVSAFLAVDELRAQGVEPTRSLAVTNFADEEGARFGVACMGSRLLTGAIEPDRARGLKDADGVTLGDAMHAAGVDPARLGRDEQALERIGVFVELHVEQGRALVDMDAAVGVATAIWPHGRWRFEFLGEANHAGTTRVDDRVDPMLPFATSVLAARDTATRTGALATFGKVLVIPNGVNAIPSAVHGWLDARAADDTVLEKLVAEVTAVGEEAAAVHGATCTVTRESYSPVVGFDDALRDRISALLDGAPQLPTGAGHDAGILSAHVPTAMLFVRNPTGVSHSPVEDASDDDCVAGVVALTKVLKELVSQ